MLLEVGSGRIVRNSFEKHNPNETLVLGVIHSEPKRAYHSSRLVPKAPCQLV